MASLQNILAQLLIVAMTLSQSALPALAYTGTPLIRSARAQTLDGVVYSARLLKDGTPVTAPVTMRFGLYAASDGGVPTWQETHGAGSCPAITPDSNGNLSATLGECVGLPILDEEQDVYLEVAINGSVTRPRLLFQGAAVPVAVSTPATEETSDEDRSLIAALQEQVNDLIAQVASLRSSSGSTTTTTTVTDGSSTTIEGDTTVSGNASVAGTLDVQGDIDTATNIKVGSSIETIANPNFKVDGGDVFVADTLGVENRIYTDVGTTVGASTQYDDGLIDAHDRALNVNTVNNQPVNLGTGLTTIGGDLKVEGSLQDLDLDKLSNVGSDDASVGRILIGDGDSFESKAVSGDISLSKEGVVTVTASSLSADSVLESHLKAVDTAGDEECLTYETTVGDFEWQSCGGGSSLASLSDVNTATATAGNFLIADGTDWESVAISGDATVTGTGVLSVSDNAIDGGNIALGSDASGDLMYYNGTDWTRLPAGTAGQLLQTNGAAAPTWVTGSSNTSDGTVTGQTLYWTGSNWAPSAVLTNDTSTIATSGDLDVSGAATVSGNISGAAITGTGSLSVETGATVSSLISCDTVTTDASGVLTCSNAKPITDGTTTYNTLVWNGTNWVESSVLTNDGSTVATTGGLDVSGTTTIAGTTTVNSDLISTGTLQAQGSLETTGGLTVGGATFLTGNLTATGTISADTGTVTLSAFSSCGTITTNANGDLVCSSAPSTTLVIDSDTDSDAGFKDDDIFAINIAGTEQLTVDGTGVTFAGMATIGQLATVNSDLVSTGTIQAQGSIETTGALTAGGTTTLTGSITADTSSITFSSFASCGSLTTSADGTLVCSSAASTNQVIDTDSDSTAGFQDDDIFAINIAGTEQLSADSTGIQIVGTLDVTGALHVDGTTLFVDAANNRVGIGTVTPSGDLDITSGANTNVTIGSGGTDSIVNLSLQNDTRDWTLNTRGDISDGFSVRDETAGAHRLFIDENGQVGIGTTAPSRTLSVTGSGLLTGGLDISGDTRISSLLTLTGDLTTDSSALTFSAFTSCGSLTTSADGTLVCSSAASTNQVIDTDSDSTAGFQDDDIFAINIAGTEQFTVDATTTAVNGSLDVSGMTILAGASTFQSLATANTDFVTLGTINAHGSLETTGNLTASGNLSVEGNTEVYGNIRTDGNITGTAQLSIDGLTTLALTHVAADLDVSANTTLSGDLSVEGSTLTFSNFTSCGSLTTSADGTLVCSSAASTNQVIDTDSDSTAGFQDDDIFAVNIAGTEQLSADSTGIQIVGTLDVTGGLHVDGTTLFVDAANNRVGIGTVTPSGDLDITSGANTNVTIGSGGTDSIVNLSLQNDTRDWTLNTRGDISDGFSVRDETAGAHRLFIDENGQVGIGTTAPSRTLSVTGSGLLTGGLDISGDTRISSLLTLTGDLTTDSSALTFSAFTSCGSLTTSADGTLVCSSAASTNQVIDTDSDSTAGFQDDDIFAINIAGTEQFTVDTLASTFANVLTGTSDLSIEGNGQVYGTLDVSGDFTAGSNTLFYDTSANLLSLTLDTSGQFIELADGTDTFGLYNVPNSPESEITANTGSLAIDSSNGKLYIKTDDGDNTNWTDLGAGSLSVSATLEATTTLAANTSYTVDTSAGDFTLTLPATPANGDHIRIIDVSASFDDNGLILTRGGSTTIEGGVSSTLTAANGTYDLFYDSTQSRWDLASHESEAPVTLHRARIHNTAVQSITHGTDTTIEFNTQDHNVGMTVDLAAEKITVTQAGYYQMTGVVNITSGTNNASYFSKLAVDGTVIAQASIGQSTGSLEEAPVVTTTKYLNVGDEITLIGRHQGTSSAKNTIPNSGTSVYLEVNQLPSAVVTNVAQATEYLHAGNISGTLTGAGTGLTVGTIDSSGSSITNNGDGSFTLEGGKTYKLTAKLYGNGANELVFWTQGVNGTQVGERGAVVSANQSSSANTQDAIAYVSPGSDTTYALDTNGGSIPTDTNAGSIVIEVIADGTKVAQFTGATLDTTGASGFIPAPNAGQNGSFLLGDGGWTDSGLLFLSKPEGTLSIGTSAALAGTLEVSGTSYLTGTSEISVASGIPLTLTIDGSGQLIGFNDLTDTFGLYNTPYGPDGEFAANIGSLALDTSAGALYIKTTGSVSNTGWTQVGAGTTIDTDEDTKITFETDSNDEDIIRFDTAGTQRLTLDPHGALTLSGSFHASTIGIGIAAPNEGSTGLSLDVSGDANVAGSLSLSDTSNVLSLTIDGTGAFMTINDLNQSASFYTQQGTPENAIVANAGSLTLDTSAGKLYIKGDSGDNTGWTDLGLGAISVGGELSTTTTLVANTSYTLDTSTGDFTVTLPAAPTDGTRVRLIDVANSFDDNNLIVSRGGSDTIEGGTSLLLSAANGTYDLFYDADRSRWDVANHDSEAPIQLHYARIDHRGTDGDISMGAAKADLALTNVRYQNGITATPGTSTFTIAQDGRYRVAVFMAGNDIDDDIDIFLRVNGTDVEQITWQEHDTNVEGHFYGEFATQNLSAGDIVNIEVDPVNTGGDNLEAQPTDATSVIAAIDIEQLPSALVTNVVQAAEYLRASLGAQINNVNDNDRIAFDTVDLSSGSSISMDTGTGIFTLAANKTYRLTGYANFNNVAGYNWYDITGGADISEGMKVFDVNNSADELAGTEIVTFFTPSVATQVELRCNVNCDGTEEVLAGQTYAVIETIADGTKVAQFTGATLDTTGASGFIPAPNAGQNGSFLLGDGGWTDSGLLFLSKPEGTLSIGTSAALAGTLEVSGTSYLTGTSEISVASGIPLTLTIDGSGQLIGFNDLTDTFGLYNTPYGPDGEFAANIGSLALDTSAGALYIKTTGSVSNTGWTQVGAGTTIDTDEDTKITFETDSNDEDIIRFDTAGTQRLTLDPHGALTLSGSFHASTIGIGIAAPNEGSTGLSLDVSGDANVAGSLSLSDTSNVLSLTIDGTGAFMTINDLNQSASFYTQQGTPENAIVANAGSLTLDTSAGKLYIKGDSGDNTGWTDLGLGAISVGGELSTTTTLVANTSYTLDTSTGDFTVTLPAAPTDGTRVRLIDVANSFDDNNLIVSRGGSDTIEGGTSLLLSAANGTYDLFYDAGRNRWDVANHDSEAPVQLHYVYLFTPVGVDQDITANGTIDLANFSTGTDPASLFDQANDRLEIQQDGLYEVTFNYMGADVDSEVNIAIQVNGSSVATLTNDSENANEEQTSSVIYLANLSDGDLITFAGDDAGVDIDQAQIIVKQLPSALVTNVAQAAEYLQASLSADQTGVGAGTTVAFDGTTASSGSSITNNLDGTFTLQAGKTYKLQAFLRATDGTANNEPTFDYRWEDSGGTEYGEFGVSSGSNDFGSQATAIAFVTPTVNTSYNVEITGVANAPDVGSTSFALIEVIADGTSVAQFTGASSTAAGTTGFIGAPQIDDQGSFLLGDGDWTTPSQIYLDETNGTLSLGASGIAAGDTGLTFHVLGNSNLTGALDVTGNLTASGDLSVEGTSLTFSNFTSCGALTTSADGTLVCSSSAASSIDGLSDGIATDADNTVYLGQDAGNTVAGAANNVGVGENVLDSVTGAAADDNTGVGHDALTALTTGNLNSAFGSGALDALTTGGSNSAFGANALTTVTTGVQNSAFGYRALEDNTAGSNSAFGFFALGNNTSGSDNAAFGAQALSANTSGVDNTGIGSGALSSVSFGDRNTAVGNNAGDSVTSGDDTTAVGTDAAGNTTGSRNTAVGSRALDVAQTGADNTAIGASALGAALVGGARNVAVGSSALANLATSSSNNIAIGYQAGDNLAAAANNNILIGHDIDGQSSTGDGQLSIGNIIFGTGVDETGTTVDADAQIGIGTASPNATLTVAGTTNVTGGLDVSDNSHIAGILTLTGALTVDNSSITLSQFSSCTTLTTSADGTLVCSGAPSSSIDDLTDAVHNLNENNVFLGHNGGSAGGDDEFNIAVGRFALDALNDSGADSNTAVGHQALTAHTAGNNNSAFGRGALLSSTTGSGNTALGHNALELLSSGTNNVVLGALAGDNIGTGSRNIVIGYDIDAPGANSDNQLNIGNTLFGLNVDAAGTIVDTDALIGIGTNSPDLTLTVAGSGRLTGGLDVSDDSEFGGTLTLTGNLTTDSSALTFSAFTSCGSLTTSADGSLVCASAASTNQVIDTDSDSTAGFQDDDIFAINIAGTEQLSVDGTTVSLAGALDVTGSMQVDGATFFVDSTNNRVGVGTAAPAELLHVYSGASGISSFNASADDLAIEGSGDTGITIASPVANDTYIIFGSSSDNDGAIITWDPTDDLFTLGPSNAGAEMVFTSGLSSERMRIDGSGNVGIGTSTPTATLTVAGTGELTGSLEVSGDVRLGHYKTCTLTTDANGLVTCGSSSSSNEVIDGDSDSTAGFQDDDIFAINIAGTEQFTVDTLASTFANVLTGTSDLSIEGNGQVYGTLDVSGDFTAGSNTLFYDTSANLLSLTLDTSGQFIELADGTDTFGLYNVPNSPESEITANTGSLAIDSSNGKLYIKTDDGDNTNWTDLGAGSLSVSATLEATTTLAANTSYTVDTSAGDFTLTLPATPANGDHIRIIDVSASFDDNGLILTRGGSTTIEGGVSSTLTAANGTYDLFYDSTQSRWDLASHESEAPVTLHRAQITLLQTGSDDDLQTHTETNSDADAVIAAGGKVTFASGDVDHEVGNIVDETNNDIVIQQAGTYQIAVEMVQEHTAQSLTIAQLVLNDTTILDNTLTHNGTADLAEAMTLQHTREFAVGDTIDVRYAGFSAGTTQLQGFSMAVNQLPSAVVTNVAQASEYLHATLAANQTSDLTAGTDHVKFDTVLASSGSSISMDTSTAYATGNGAASIGRVTLQGGKTYRITAAAPLTNSSSSDTALDVVIRNATTGVSIGTGSSGTGPGSSNTEARSGPGAVAIVTPATDTLYELHISGINNVNHIIGADAGGRRQAWMLVELIADSTKVAQFTGATASANGATGFIGAPQAGDQGSFLLGDGDWSDPNQLFLDETNGTLTIGTSAVDAGDTGLAFHVQGNANITGALDVTGDFSAGSGTLYYSNTLGTLSIGTSQAHTAAALDISSDTRGILLPRLATTERDAITGPDAGLLLYNNTDNAFNFYDGDSWEAVGTGGLTVNATLEGTTTLAANTSYTVDTSAGDFTLTLPSAPTDGAHIRLIDVSASFDDNGLIVSRGGTDTIEGGTSTTLTAQNGTYDYYYDATQDRWDVADHNGPAPVTLESIVVTAPSNTASVSESSQDKVAYDTTVASRGSLTFANNKVTLRAGRTYKLSVTSASFQASESMRFYDFTAGAGIGTNIQVDTGASGVSLEYEFTPAVDSEVGVVTSSGHTTKNSGTQLNQFYVQELPSAIITQQYAGGAHLFGIDGNNGVGGSIAAATFPFETTLMRVGNDVAHSNGTFTLQGGRTYKLTGTVGWQRSGSSMLRYRWHNSSGTQIGVEAASTNDAGSGIGEGNGTVAIAYINVPPGTTDTVTLNYDSNSTTIDDIIADRTWASIEVVASDIVTTFTGATGSVAGTAGFIGAPQAGDQGAVLLGDGDWVDPNVLFVDEANERLGIGIASPTSTLHVSSSGNTNAQLVSPTANSIVNLSLVNDARDWTINNRGDLADSFSVRDETAGAHRLVIDANGQVGIGTTSPNATLTVDGTAELTGSLEVSGDVRLGHYKTCTLTTDTNGLVTCGSGSGSINALSDGVATDADDTVYLGQGAGNAVSGAASNVGVGENVLNSVTTNAADDNTAVGHNSLTALTTGAQNAAFGGGTGAALTTGSQNVFLGQGTGGAVVAGDQNILIGAGLDSTGDTSGFLSIGNAIYGLNVDANGSTVDTDALIGIGTNTPTRTLSVDGSALITGGLDISGETRISTASNGTAANTNADDLVIDGDANAGISIITPNTGAAEIMFGDSDANRVGRVRYDHSSNVFSLFANDNEFMRATGTSDVVFNDDSGATDFRVESNNNDNMLLVDGGSDRVGIGTSTPNATLTVSGTANVTGGLDVSGDFQAGSGTLFHDASTGFVGIGTTNPEHHLTVHTNSGSNPSAALTDGDVSHPFSVFHETDVALAIDTAGSATGGGSIYGYTDDSATALFIGAFVGSTDPVDTTPAIEYRIGKSDGGTGSADLGALETALTIGNHNSSTDYLTILGSGNVGIGTATPSETLTVSGTANVTGGLDVSGDVEIGSAVLYADVVNNQVGIGTSSPTALGAGGTPTILNVHSGGTGVNDYGTAILSSASTTNDGLMGALQFGSSALSGAEKRTAFIASNKRDAATDDPTGDLTFHTANSGTLSERMRIDSSGNVGIGIPNPTVTLDVSGGAVINQNGDAIGDFRVESTQNTHTLYVAANTGQVTVGSATPRGTLSMQASTADTSLGNNTDPTLGIYNADATDSTYSGVVFYGGTESGGTQRMAHVLARTDDATAGTEDGSLHFFTTENGGTQNNRMTIASDGSVGIGDTTPDAKLDVESSDTTGQELKVTNTGVYTDTLGVVALEANSLTTGRLVNLDVNGITSGSGLEVSTTGTAFTTGSLIDAVATNGVPAASWTGAIGKFEYLPNAASANVDGDALRAGFGGTAGASDGTAANFTSNQTGANALVLRVNDDGTYADATPFVVNVDGEVGIGTASPGYELDISQSEVGGEVVARVRNEDNSNTASNAFLRVEAGGTSGGDAGVQIVSNGTSDWSVGVDNSDSDKFKISRSTAIGTLPVLTIDGSENVGIGTASPLNPLHIADTTDPMNLQRFSADVNGPIIFSDKSRNATVGSHTVVQANDVLGGSFYRGSDGDSYEQAARIQAEVDGTPGDGDMPGRLTFYTTPDGSATPSERMRINSTGDVGIGTTSPRNGLDINLPSNDEASLFVGGNALSTAAARLELGEARTGNGFAYIDLTGDTTYSDFGFRIIRSNTGANAETQLVHRGTGNFNIHADEAATMNFQTDSATRLAIDPNGNFTFTGVDASGVVGVIENTSTDSNADGIIIELGPNSNPGTSNNYVNFRDGDGDSIDEIEGDGAGGTRYTGDAQGTYSDRRLKENILAFDGDALGLLDDLDVVTFNYKDGTNPGLARYGFVAQDAYVVLPQAVNFGDDMSAFENEDGTLGDAAPELRFNYSQVTPLLTKGIQDLNTKVDNNVVAADALFDAIGLGLSEEQTLQVVSNADALAGFSAEASRLTQVAAELDLTMDELVQNADTVQQFLANSNIPELVDEGKAEMAMFNERLAVLEAMNRSESTNDDPNTMTNDVSEVSEGVEDDEVVSTSQDAPLEETGESSVAGVQDEQEELVDEKGLLAKITEAIGQVFSKAATFLAKVTFRDQVVVSGDTAGVIEIPEGSRAAKVVFTQPYDSRPVVTATLSTDVDFFVRVIDVGRHGFTVKLNEIASRVVTVDWQALGQGGSGAVVEILESEDYESDGVQDKANESGVVQGEAGERGSDNAEDLTAETMSVEAATVSDTPAELRKEVTTAEPELLEDIDAAEEVDALTGDVSEVAGVQEESEEVSGGSNGTTTSTISDNEGANEEGSATRI